MGFAYARKDNRQNRYFRTNYCNGVALFAEIGIELQIIAQI
jgi:hypothetical protein